MESGGGAGRGGDGAGVVGAGPGVSGQFRHGVASKCLCPAPSGQLSPGAGGRSMRRKRIPAGMNYGWPPKRQCVLAPSRDASAASLKTCSLSKGGPVLAAELGRMPSPRRWAAGSTGAVQRIGASRAPGRSRGTGAVAEGRTPSAENPSRTLHPAPGFYQGQPPRRRDVWTGRGIPPKHP